ncbi:MerR family DNA-binding protein [Chromobacterium haemolyticum]|uniref:MerR family DNA-binding protein n=1 Tax=Chromobacterium haemolyticum TaxID=394935 RepID=UPI004056CCAE
MPSQRTPTPRDWEALSADWLPRLQQRIDELTRLRDRLGNCIGCGCLSLSQCALYNPGDCAASQGDGPRYLIGEPPAQPPGQDGG